ncbi:lipopolysaccharide biosynthesis protein [Klebsiella oxytoca]|uniref:lipopolysaccharide biosynthesis protein n=1 Tax=Klebsiella oxytoca TaxID=571 RepID=UPI001092FA35|nr:lipopolysaccharide biosynthesis protein [Klebsiella oxytoca]EHG8285256.1 lipopolysaccharide biosynthesis protein [Klebsiella oxytoca]EJG2196339.1 lipopolysaccharide biosynthesis protein [Klebsiella oxytoca]MBG2651514.1 lipopolysaccharide biosynthesis protein [Klebsiella oxytoca]TGN43570.1 lipopolysaccharide biosynthesis protein [Klebsiella oxytoca]HBM3278006.1 lipopolysaccharide biosynthesis protein [Klebsiella oxytoca]
MNLISNAKWNAFSQFIKMAIQVVNLVYLAKIIPPAEYGLMAMAVVVMNLGILLRDLGTSAAIIQRKNISNSQINSIFWLNVFLGVMLAILMISLAPFISYIYSEPSLTLVLIFLSVTFPLSSCAATHLALLEKVSHFRKISTIEISSSLLAAIFAIVFANLGYGVYSLVIQAIVLNLCSALQFWFASSWRPSFKKLILVEDLKDIFGFSAHLSIFNLINYFSRNADSFLIGKFMSSFILGSYNLAYRIMLFPIQSLTYVATRSLYPILSHHQDDNNKIKDTYLNCVLVILVLTCPLMSGIAILSRPFISIVFGPQWHITAEVLQWLAPTAIIQSVLSTTGSVFMAKGKTNVLMKLGFVGAFLQVGSFIIGVNYSISVLAKFYLLANIINFFPVMLCLFSTVSINFSDFIKKIWPVIISTLFMVMALFLVNIYFINFSTMERFDLLVGVSFFGAFVYIISLFFCLRPFRLLFIRK